MSNQAVGQLNMEVGPVAENAVLMRCWYPVESEGGCLHAHADGFMEF